MSEVKATQPEIQMNFIKKDLTLLKNVDEVCDEIKGKEKRLNLLFMTQGTLSMKGRDGKLHSFKPYVARWPAETLLPRNLRRNGQKDDDKLLLPTTTHPATPTPPPRRLPIALPSSISPRPRLRIRFHQLRQPRPENQLLNHKCQKPRHHHDRLRF